MNVVRLSRLSGVIAALLTAVSAGAQEWKPAKNVEIVVNSGAGGAADRSARVAQRLLGAEYGQLTERLIELGLVTRPGR